MKDRKQEILEKIEQNAHSKEVIEDIIERIERANRGSDVREALRYVSERLNEHVFYRLYKDWLKLLRYDITRTEFINALKKEERARVNSTRRYERELRKLNDET